jgi:chemotaxis protein methyltransferase CheR
MLTPNGWLFIGHSESLFRVSDRFRHLGRTIYRKVP